METTDRDHHADQARLSGLERHIGYWLRRVSNHVSGAFARALQTQQTSVAEWVLLCILQEQQGMAPAELADAMGFTRGAVSKILDKLEAKKWTTRKTSQQDNRVQLLSVTRQGYRVLPELAEIANRNDEQFFDCLDAKERATLQQLLQRLADFHRMRKMPTE